jgi:hypothetical protein
MELVITTENPEVHWGFVNVKDRIVLDLGCGRVWHTDRQRSSDKHLHWPDTPEFFLNRGASQVIGVDPRSYEIERYQDEYLYNDDKGIFLCQEITAAKDIQDLIEGFNPNCVKVDIEHHEKVLVDLSRDVIKKVDEWYVECHTSELFNDVVMKLILTHNLEVIGRLHHSSPQARVIKMVKI